ncbi:MAG: SMI1/KNR4 family protein [Myxococcota bacterium]
MHRGVREFVEWVDGLGTDAGLNPPAQTADLRGLEQVLGEPLPADLRLVLSRFNGGTLPCGIMLPAGTEPGSIGDAIRQYAEAVGADFLDPELLLPFHRTPEGSLLAFDRSSGPVSDTWPIVDYYSETGELRLVHRTFDGWCRRMVADFTSGDPEEFTVETYLRAGLRHAEVEPDVATAHATVAHAYRRAGEPERALHAYLRAAECLPPLHWCDWEALKIAALLGDESRALKAATQLCSRAPRERWNERETTPARVAEAIGWIVEEAKRPRPWLELLRALERQSEDEAPVVAAIIAAMGGEMPPTRPVRDASPVPAQDDSNWWGAVQQAYASGVVRDDDLLFDPVLRPLGRRRPFGEILRIRRDF